MTQHLVERPDSDGALESQIGTLVLEYAQAPGTTPLGPELRLREDLGVASLSLVSLLVRIGEELGADVTEHATELGRLRTIGDLVGLARALERSAAKSSQEPAAEV